jgi:2-oxoisovalerate dehydrogenase E1 component
MKVCSYGPDERKAALSTSTMTRVDAFRRMAEIRRFEEQALELSREGLVSGSIHLCLGQEAIPVGALAALDPDDRVIATYRGHGWALACGSEPVALMAEVAHREAGVNGGRAGSPLLSDPGSGFLGENSIVGAGVPIAGGVALSGQIQGTKGIVVVSIGDGAMNQGATFEGMIFAAAKNLPVIYICENNGWSEMTPISATTRGEDLADRGRGIGIESHVVDGCDPFAVAEAVSAAAEVCRRGAGPVLLECKTVRLSGHYNKDVEHYRPVADRDDALARDPLLRMLEAAETDERAEFERVDLSVTAEMEDAADTVRGLDLADPATVLDHLYGETPTAPRRDLGDIETKDLKYFRAINLALAEALEDRPEVVLFGEDVGYAGGIFGVTRGLQKQYGSDRVFDTPIAESAILGAGVGAAIAGLRPVVEIMWADFVLVALDQIVNQAANVRYVSRGLLTAPLTIRMQQGATPGSCAQHSQSLEALFAHVPGIKVGLPSSPRDAYEMTRAAILDPDPTLLIEHRALYQETGPVQLGGPAENVGGARLRREGTDLGIIAWGTAVGMALTAAESLSRDGIEAAILDLRWLRPLDVSAIAQLVQRTGGRIVVAHEATLTGGFGAEIASGITERHFDQLVRPVARVGSADTRIPAAPTLQSAVLLTPERIEECARRQVEG